MINANGVFLRIKGCHPPPIIRIMSSPLDRVQAHTSNRVNERIRMQARRRLLEAATETPAQITERIHKLEQEWDIERYLAMNASALAFTGVVAGLLVDKKFFVIPCLVLPFLFQHAVHGWCPPIPVLRRRGIRTQKEIDEEKFALKALRGDFAELKPNPSLPLSGAENAWNAAAG